MIRYRVKTYKRGGWVIVETETGREIVLFSDKNKAEDACGILNECEE